MLISADELLEKLAVYGGVIVSTSKITTLGIAELRACGLMHVNKSGLGFVLLKNTNAVPDALSRGIAELVNPVT